MNAYKIIYVKLLIDKHLTLVFLHIITINQEILKIFKWITVKQIVYDFDYNTLTGVNMDI